MLALFALMAPGYLLPDISFKSVDGALLSLGLFRGKYVALVCGLDLNAASDLAAIKALGEINTEEKDFRPVVLCPASVGGGAVEASRPAYVYEAGEQAFLALGDSSPDKPVRRAMYVNPAGRLVKEWVGFEAGTIARDIAAWVTGSSLPIGYAPPDPRPFLYEGGWLGKPALDNSGNPMPFVRPASERGLLVLFLATRGPVDALYIDRIKAVAAACKEAGVSVLALFPAYDETQAGVAGWARSSGFEFPCSVDPGSVFADAYRATRTPEAFLMDSKGAVVYTGAIDSSSWDRETNRRYLLDAVKALAAGEAVRPDRTMPFGTVIRRSKADERERRGGG